MKRIGLIAAGFFVLAAAAAPPADAQSLWGINFLGEHRMGGSARDRALGFSSIALSDSFSAIAANGASLADIRRVTLSAFELLGMSRVRTDEHSVNQNRFLVPTIMIAAPIRRGIVFSIGYRTRFEGRGDFAFSDPSVPEAPRPYSYYEHRSNLFTAPIGLAWRATEWLSVSGELQIERGSIIDEVSNKFENTDYSEVFSRWKRIYSGTSWGVAALFKPHSRIHAGAFYDHEIGYSVDEQFDFSLSSIDSTASFDFELPAAFGAGLAVGLTDRIWLSSSYWRREAPDPAGFPQLSGSLNDESLIAFGIERRASEEGGFFSRIPLRLGFYQNLWHLQFPAGENLAGRFVTLGAGFRMPGGPGMIDLSVEFGQIGSVDNNGVDDQVVRIGAGLSFNESWLRRRQGQRR